jgi:Flp pilus assembly pilin Flp
MTNKVRVSCWLRDRERGQTTIESALLIALCGIALIVAILFLRPALASLFTSSGHSAADVFRPPTAPACDSNYSGACIPPYPPDIDCSDLAALGIAQVTVTGSDPHNLDPDGDGIGCD